VSEQCQQSCLSVEANSTDKLFCSCDLDLDPMTLVYETNLDILILNTRYVPVYWKWTS